MHTNKPSSAEVAYDFLVYENPYPVPDSDPEGRKDADLRHICLKNKNLVLFAFLYIGMGVWWYVYLSSCSLTYNSWVC